MACFARTGNHHSCTNISDTMVNHASHGYLRCQTAEFPTFTRSQRHCFCQNRVGSNELVTAGISRSQMPPTQEDMTPSFLMVPCLAGRFVGYQRTHSPHLRTGCRGKGALLTVERTNPPLPLLQYPLTSFFMSPVRSNPEPLACSIFVAAFDNASQAAFASLLSWRLPPRPVGLNSCLRISACTVATWEIARALG